MGGRDRLRGPDRRHERHLREPEPARQTRSPPGLRIPQPRESAQARPHCLHPRHKTPITHRNRQENTPGNRPETPSRLTSPDFGAENLAGLLGSFIGALPDLYAAEQDITAENDLVMVRLAVTATVKGSLLGVPADGKPVRWNAVDIYRVTDGKISEEWAADDIATIMAQLGVFSPPWAA